ncbi:hypothetical protein HMPREF9306_01244 [Propionimicrobium lymphophilum ACS-093-V-SCH5]|uniref:Uncharacterized protein n=1 Tax=Propionimicrobium lymphophilum ACS-093-V-SCH5 TaxID=883161 RepID=S2W1B1_9ACTN|nr:hypothetical protein [Propionimicrobium lymphophilum]EPD32936.1 hypothetical protein HMPREF9306_01244 [Propionimicrobium lymphophilum ACS-093-V-SCH5]
MSTNFSFGPVDREGYRLLNHEPIITFDGDGSCPNGCADGLVRVSDDPDDPGMWRCLGCGEVQTLDEHEEVKENDLQFANNAPSENLWICIECGAKGIDWSSDESGWSWKCRSCPGGGRFVRDQFGPQNGGDVFFVNSFTGSAQQLGPFDRAAANCVRCGARLAWLDVQMGCASVCPECDYSVFYKSAIPNWWSGPVFIEAY